MVKIPVLGTSLQQPQNSKTAKGAQRPAQGTTQGQASGQVQAAGTHTSNFARQAVSDVTRIVQENFNVQNASVAISKASTILQTQRSGLESVGEKLQGIDRTLRQASSRHDESKGASRLPSGNAGGSELKGQLISQLEDLTQLLGDVRFQGQRILDPQSPIDSIKTGIEGRPEIEIDMAGINIAELGLSNLDLESKGAIKGALDAIDQASRLVRGQVEAIDHKLLDLEIDTVSLDVAAENRYAARSDFFDVNALPPANLGFEQAFSSGNSEQAILAQGSDSEALNQLLS